MRIYMRRLIMNYEIEVLAALTQLPEPTTQEMASATGISERKVQTVIKTLQNDFKVDIKKVKQGRHIRYVITGWGVFESGGHLKQVLATRPTNRSNRSNAKITKSTFYESVKMSNYKESSRLEGISIEASKQPAFAKKTSSTTKRALVKKYSQYKKMCNAHG